MPRPGLDTPGRHAYLAAATAADFEDEDGLSGEDDALLTSTRKSPSERRRQGEDAIRLSLDGLPPPPPWDGAGLASATGERAESGAFAEVASAPRAAAKATPLPYRQVIPLCFIQLGQAVVIVMPMTMLVYMVRTFPEARDNEAVVGRYTGFIASLFQLSQFLSALPLGRASDRVGRKPIVLLGTVSTLLSTICLGFCRDVPQAAVVRIMGGLPNGILGAIKTCLSELTDSSNQGLAFSFMSLAWGLGATIGPIIGGSCVFPCDRPALAHAPGCGEAGLFRRFPFLAACLIGSLFGLTSVVLALSLTETLGMRNGRKLPASPLAMRPLRREDSPGGGKIRPMRLDEEDRDGDDADALREDAPPSPPSGPLARARAWLRQQLWPPAAARTGEPSWWQQRNTMLCVVGYSAVALLFILLDEIVPIFAASPRAMGGLGLLPDQLAPGMSFGGLVLFCNALLVYPPLDRRFGTLAMAQFGLGFALVPLVLFPCDSLLPPYEASAAARALFWLGHGSRSVAANHAFTASMILVNRAAPPRQMGVVNGFSQSLVALVRGSGPFVGGALWSAAAAGWVPGHQFSVFGLCAMVAAGACLLYSFVKDEKDGGPGEPLVAAD